MFLFLPSSFPLPFLLPSFLVSSQIIKSSINFSLFIRKPVLSRTKFIVQVSEALEASIYPPEMVSLLALQGWAMGDGVRNRGRLSPLEGI